MPVIGRLDGQVDEVLISPVSRRRRGELEDAPAGAEGAESPAPSAEETHTPRADESSAGPGELPVWLL